ncbi:MAG TPA: DUF3500 domain-containing protein [Vicinamibacterales bacterium]|nr:DUF3500 domain-containing protein [Vicinamibacterales bacterium]
MTRSGLAAVLGIAALSAAYAQTTRPEALMERAARTLIDRLDATQREAISFPFDADERVNWHFVPIARKGLPLKQMTPSQREAAVALLRTGLSASGFTKAEAIRQLEDVLAATERGSIVRDKELYFFTIFGKPGDAKWGWRYEGHHLSQNWTIANGRAVGTTPAFMGANPAEVLDGPMRGSRPLGQEEDLGRAFLMSLSEAQRKEAIVSATAPRDIISGDSKQAARIEDSGIRGSSLNQAQKDALLKVIQEFASTQPGMLAAERMAKVTSAGLDDVRFTWMGAIERGPGKAHYFRIQGSSFLIEFDNTQNNANHQHTVWRDFNGDFGRDLLAEHYATSPHHQLSRR